MDAVSIGMLVILAVLIFFMFRNGQKRKRETENLQSKVVPGAEVMTNFGLYGTILAIDEGDNKVQLETSPGQVLTLHRQTITRVIEETEAEAPDAELNEDNAEYVGEPEFGERSTDADTEASASGSSQPGADDDTAVDSRDKKNDE
ncbi:hypothetical protein GCM10027416_20050 [Okibacterium endophyticum]